MGSFFAELRRRNVLRVAAAYALVAWIIIEAGSVLLPTFGASEAFFQGYVIVVLLGFLVSLVFAWVFEITPDGVKLDRDVDRSSEPATPPRAMTNYAIIGLLILALAVSVLFNVLGVRDSAEPTVADIMQDRRSIAVLPFGSRSTDSDNALFADGVHDDLLTKLANIGALKVISRTSVMEYRNTTKNLRQIGRELGVDTLLEGTVQRVGGNVRINVQLIDAESDEHLWAEIYDREISDDNLFQVQSEVSAQIAAALRTTLMPGEEFAAAEVPTENLRAYSLYTSGRDNLYLRRLETLQAARLQFEEALALDPEYAQAHVALAECLILLFVNHQAIPQADAESLAESHLETAIDLDPNLSDAYATLGLLRLTSWSATRLGTENLDAEAAFEQALALNPNNARAYMWFANLRDAEGRIDEAIGYYHRSMQLDPLGRVPYNNLPTLYAQRGENEYAIRLWLDAIEIHPDWPVPYQLLAAHLAGLGRLDEAIAWDRLGRQLSSESEILGNLGVGIYAEFGDFERAKEMVREIPEGHPLSSLEEAFLLLLDRQFSAASEVALQVAENNPDLPAYINGIASDLALLAGNYDVAREQMLVQNPAFGLDAALEIDRFTIRDVVKLAFIEKSTGNDDRSRRLLNAALPVVQELPRLGVFGQGIRDAQIYAIKGQTEDAISALRQAIDDGYRSSAATEQWIMRFDPYFASLRGDERFEAMMNELDELNAVMYQNVLDSEASGDWERLTSLAGSI